MSESTLFTPLKVGNLQLAHRITLPPMTRYRVTPENHIPLDMVTEYYAQRASVPGTLLITEAILISQRTGVYKNVPGLWTPEQIAQWRKVTDAVHAKGSYIYAQLWTLGRVADIEATRGELGDEAGGQLISASEVPFYEGVVPRAMSEHEIQAVIADFASAAKNAVEAGFDGVEIHGANGYLVDQFIQGAVNKRTDRWGGSIENRARFPLEALRAVIDAIGAERTAIRYSPWSTFQGMRQDSDAELIEQFGYLARETAKLGLAYVHVVEARIAGNTETDEHPDRNLEFFFREYGRAGPIMVAGGYVGESAREAVDVQYKGYDVLVAIGRPWTANPDLPFKVKQGIPLRKYEREHFYTVRSPKGYIDYEFSDEFNAAAAAA
ncbi:Putative NADH:flavin oxidoreductase/NADH oxidase family protein (AFU_orthologue; AFUA_2G04060) [Aspergillus calidoustus]|uniref:Putative NADH:flavin oxidoreductase/NADH oxidase family protein (AFU_orthologue AFUA_2G04060) n=1 Tax=Aspergillus calidoustus TaxID=454130 RepID=A0A0U5CPU9_ASPCI|nr:Putative NADH:flavin oxidoreductase/NADH oxidase family protein (AFU_orthologue; AFUA_2G04060) [Aspergillus calidoustus]